MMNGLPSRVNRTNISITQVGQNMVQGTPYHFIKSISMNEVLAAN